jgi:hypothetical protein
MMRENPALEEIEQGLEVPARGGRRFADQLLGLPAGDRLVEPLSAKPREMARNVVRHQAAEALHGGLVEFEGRRHG